MSQLEPDQNPPGVPNEIPIRTPTSSLALLQGGTEGVRSWLRVFFGIGLAVLLVVDIFQYSLYQSLHARVENHDRRIERLNKMIDDLLTTNQNAQKIEKIEQQVDGIDSQVHELTEAIKEQNAKTEEPEPEKL